MMANGFENGYGDYKSKPKWFIEKRVTIGTIMQSLVFIFMISGAIITGIWGLAEFKAAINTVVDGLKHEAEIRLLTDINLQRDIDRNDGRITDLRNKVDKTFR